LLDLVELALLVDVDEDVPVHRLVEPGALAPARLEDGIAVEHDDRRPPFGGA